MDAHLQEERNKILISEPAKSFLSATKVQFFAIVKIEGFKLKIVTY
jgi:hypothetical protein